jgi:tetratricopeptide (TPR) repeat protein
MMEQKGGLGLNEVVVDLDQPGELRHRAAYNERSYIMACRDKYSCRNQSYYCAPLLWLINMEEFKLGIAAESAGNVPDAIAHYTAAIEMQPQLHLAHYNLGLCYMTSLKNYTQARVAFERALAVNPQFADCHVSIDGLAISLTDDR